VTDTNVIKLAQPGTFTDSLTEILRNGARALLSQAVETEVTDFLGRHAELKTEAGHQRVVRHGHLPEREIMTGIGPVAVRQPRVRDREAVGGERIRFSPTILPPYARRTKSLEVLIPILYLKGISTGGFEEALGALLGKDAGGLSASTIARLKEAWIDEHARWLDRDLSPKRYVYVWADGIYVQARLEDDAQCLLVIIGATAEGKKELVGLADGIRENAQSEGAAARSQAARCDDRPAARRRRRGTRLLEGDRRGVAEDTGTTLLGAQNRECLEQAAEEPASKGQAGIAGHLDGGDQEDR
jgi:transposase-like protein